MFWLNADRSRPGPHSKGKMGCSPSGNSTRIGVSHRYSRTCSRILRSRTPASKTVCKLSPIYSTHLPLSVVARLRLWGRYDILLSLSLFPLSLFPNPCLDVKFGLWRVQFSSKYDLRMVPHANIGSVLLDKQKTAVLGRCSKTALLTAHMERGVCWEEEQ